MSRATAWLLPVKPTHDTLDDYDWWPVELSKHGWNAVTISGVTHGRLAVCSGPGTADSFVREFAGIAGELEWKATQAVNLVRLWPMI